jgi:hypothetical protein
MLELAVYIARWIYVKSRSYYKRILLIIGDRLGWWCEGGGTRKGKRVDLYKFLAVTGRPGGSNHPF